MLVLHLRFAIIAIVGRSIRVSMGKHRRLCHGACEPVFLYGMGFAGCTSTYTLPVVLNSSPLQLSSGVYPLVIGDSLHFLHAFFCVDVDSIWPRSDGCRARIIIVIVAPLTAISLLWVYKCRVYVAKG